MKNISRLLSILALVCAFAVMGQGQTSLTQTTLASAVKGPAFYSGTTPAIDQTVFLASVTGISVPVLPGTPVSVIYVGREAMGVFGVSTALNSVNVIRGYLGTYASPHPSGDMVLISNVYNTTSQYGANPVPSGFFNVDPPQGGTCNATAIPTTPWVNVLTGAQWLCSAATSTWVPGFNNPLSTVGAPAGPVASVAGAITPSGPFFHITGTNAITGFTPPIGCNATAVGGCTFTFIADAVFSWTAAGNIAFPSASLPAQPTTAGLVVVGQAYTFVWNGTTSKWNIVF